MFPIQVTIRDTPKSKSLENIIRKRAEKLSHYSQRITICRIMIDMPQKHKHQGKLFRVRIDLAVPGKELVVNRKLNEDVYIAITEAFEAIERKLESYSRRRVTETRRRKRIAANGQQTAAPAREKEIASYDAVDALFWDEVDEYEDVTQLVQEETHNMVNN